MILVYTKNIKLKNIKLKIKFFIQNPQKEKAIAFPTSSKQQSPSHISKKRSPFQNPHYQSDRTSKISYHQSDRTPTPQKQSHSHIPKSDRPPTISKSDHYPKFPKTIALPHPEKRSPSHNLKKRSLSQIPKKRSPSQIPKKRSHYGA